VNPVAAFLAGIAAGVLLCAAFEAWRNRRVERATGRRSAAPPSLPKVHVSDEGTVYRNPVDIMVYHARLRRWNRENGGGVS
jgi:hypothetical protein